MSLDLERMRELSKKHSIRVLRATQSPLNKLRWHCDLECGHETWHRGTRKPKRAYCYTCNPLKGDTPSEGR